MSATALPHPPVQATPAIRSRYVACLTWAFAVFSSARVLAYLPTVWAIQSTGDSSQHSLWTWGLWLGANATMAAWLHEQAGRRMTKAASVSACNAVMCLLVVATVVFHRF